MKKRSFWEKYENCIITILTIIVNMVLFAACFDFYYNLNDDMMMKDIMAGIYTGVPDGHNMQTLYILGAFISLCYRLCRGIPWYGLFLLLCQMGSLYLVGVRLLRFCKRKWAKAGCMFLMTLFIWGIMLPYMTALHYTFTCAMLAASAIFLFMTTPGDLTVKQFVVWNIPSILFVVLAYQIRTEMLLLVFPLICLAGLFRWAEEEKFIHKENFCKYGTIFACIAIGMLVSRCIDFAAYGSADWKKFLVFFEKRTEVYDYHLDIITKGEDKDYLYSIGLNDAQQELLANYNFGLDEEIDEEVLGEIAAYAAAESSYPAGAADIVMAFRLYIYRFLHEEDAPYNRLVIYGYLSIAATGICMVFMDGMRARKWAFVWELILLGVFRTLLWMFLLIRGRYPERITHSLYLAELLLLLGMLCRQLWQPGKLGKMYGDCREESWRGVMRSAVPVLALLFGVLCVSYLPQSMQRASADKAAREASHREYLEVAQYCRSHPGNFYFLDVYSTVGYTQKIFQNVDNSVANYDIMGGWICKSPLYREKLERFGIETAEEGLLHNDSVFFVIAQNEDVAWLPAYYAQKGTEVSMEQVDSIADGYAVYRVR